LVRSVYDTSHPDNQLPDNQLDTEGGRWAVLCEEHDLYINVATQAQAGAALDHPKQVCDECAAALNADLGDWCFSPCSAELPAGMERIESVNSIPLAGVHKASGL
jgi:hypothetical protein